MADSYVQFRPDSTGKLVQAYENTIASQVVEAQAVVLQDAAGWTDSYVESVDGSGKKLQYFQNTIGADVVHALAVVLVDTSGAAL